MKKLLIVLPIILLLTTCKKYDEGGWISLTRKHLFGGNDVGDSKTWKLKKYEVNGIDSTDIIQANKIQDFYNITFKLTDKKARNFAASTVFQSYLGSVGGKEFGIALSYIDLTKEDSAQCKIINNVVICYRQIFLPEAKTLNRSWELKKLTSEELIIEKTITNNYKIVLTN